jgi:S-DNA-T family DNA segregation ATPase FtsK/SpoIIIE
MRGALIALAAAVAVAFAILTSWSAALIIAAVLIFLTAPFFFLARVLAAAIVAAFVFEGALFVWANPLILAAAVAAVLARPVFSVARLASVPASARRFYAPMLWAAWRWRWLCRNLSLGYVDRHHRRLLRPRIPGTTAVRVEEHPAHIMRWPRAYRWRLDRYGWSFRIKTVPRTGRAEIAAQARQIADAHRAHRISVTQLRPGVLEVRSLRVDPLAQPYPLEECPADAFTAAAFPGRLLIGRDEHGAWRYLALPNVTGITVTGLPGAGKSTLITSWLCQLAPCPVVAPLILDGKGSQEWSEWQGRAVVLGDDLDVAEEALAAVDAEMRRRQAVVRDLTGHKNGWATGPIPAMPLLLVVIDECDRFLNATAYRGSPKDEARARHMAQLAGGLIRRGRSALILTILATQTGLAESFGNSQTRNNCALSVCFAVRARESAVASLGDAIKDFPDLSPITHQGPELVGVCTSTLRTGLDVFTRLRCPEISEAAAAERASLPAPHRPAIAAPPPRALV